MTTTESFSRELNILRIKGINPGFEVQQAGT